MSAALETFFSTLPERSAQKDLTGVRTSYAFAIENGKSWTVRIEEQNVTVKEGVDESIDCTITASEETFNQLLDREQTPMSAYLNGALKLSGDLGAAMQLQRLLS
jgi:putative sterol carrier protein